MKQKGLGRGLDAIFGSEHLDAKLKPMSEMAEISISEIFPNTIRSQAVAIAVAAQWISNFLVSATFPSLSAWSVGGTYCIYALMSLASAVFVWRWVPETKGKTLEEMSALWKSGSASR